MDTTLSGRPTVTVVSVTGETWRQFAERFPFGTCGPNCNRCGQPVDGHSREACPGGRTMTFTQDPADGSMTYAASWVVREAAASKAERVARLHVRLQQAADAIDPVARRQAIASAQAELAALGRELLAEDAPAKPARRPAPPEDLALLAAIDAAYDDDQSIGLDLELAS